MPNTTSRQHLAKAAYNRRSFLQSTMIATSAMAIGAPTILRARNLNEKLNLAIIGTGGRGGSNLRSVESENIVALCDVNENNLKFGASRHPRARQTTDFRKLYDHAGEFDAVVISTCEHTHAFATMPALLLGKHVYCEKPLTHSIWEARKIREAAGKANVATQQGTQIHAQDNYRRVVELIQSGAIGSVSETHVWVNRAWGRQSAEDAKTNRDIVAVRERPAGKPAIPSSLNWDLWLGPAPKRAFNNVYFPGPKWYRWWDFGNGTMSDLGSHWVDLPFWALNLDHPQTIHAKGPVPHAEIAPASMEVTYEYGARDDRAAVNLTWYQGSHKPKIWQDGGIPKWNSGVLFVGDKGMLLSSYSKHVLLPEDKFVDFKRPEPTIAKSLGHHAEWIHACKTGAPTTCNFEYAGWLTEANHLGNVAFRVGKKLHWDHAQLRATNAPEADELIHREYRKGWSLT
jgi:predicted dehydrogenase